MPGKGSFRARRWASKLDRIVTDDGATIDFCGSLSWRQRERVIDDDLIRLLTTAVERINVPGCVRLTDAAMFAVAENCPNLLELNVWECKNLTNVSMGAIADQCPKLAELRAVNCTQITEIKAMANLTKLIVVGCQLTGVSMTFETLTVLNVTRCNLTDEGLATIVENRSLATLTAISCGLTALPSTIGMLAKLRKLDVTDNRLRELPRSIADLDCTLLVGRNPLLVKPPFEIARQGIPAIRQYFLTI